MAIGGEEEVKVHEPRRYCGLSKKIVYGILALVVIIVIAAVVGGAVGSRGSKKSSKSTSVSPSPTSISSETATSAASLATATPTPTATSAPTVNLGAIAASNFYDDGSYLSVYYQKGSNIMYTIYNSSSTWATPQNLTLSTTPKIGTPLAAVSLNGTSGAEVSSCRSIPTAIY